jgi:hypothetical protein
VVRGGTHHHHPVRRFAVDPDVHGDGDVT